MFANAVSAVQATSLIEIGGVLLALGLIAVLASRAKLSAVPLFLLTGLALGNGGLFDLEVSQGFLDTAASIGAVLLLLLLGMEYSARELATAVKGRGKLAALDLFTGTLPGAIVALLLGWGVAGVVALAGITYVSSSGIATELIRDSGWTKSEVAKRVVSVLVVEDLVMAPYLPLATATFLGLGAVSGLLSVSLALVVTGVIFLASYRYESLSSSRLSAQEPVSLLLIVFGAALLAAGLADSAGFSGAVAAFLVGLVLTGEVAQAARTRLMPLRDLFSAVFFLYFGLTTHPSDLIAALPLAGLLALFAIAGKALVAKALVADMSNPASWWRASAFLIPRGEFSLLIAGLAGTTSFGASLLPIVTAYVLLTTTFATLVLRFSLSELAK
jgi:CPA2 family monovalent cation:H+ antiporter-2